MSSTVELYVSPLPILIKELDIFLIPILEEEKEEATEG